MKSVFIRQLSTEEFESFVAASNAPQKSLANITDSCLSEKEGKKVVRLNYCLNRGNAKTSKIVNLDEIDY